VDDVLYSGAQQPFNPAFAFGPVRRSMIVPRQDYALQGGFCSCYAEFSSFLSFVL
jgi:hypothetical protein